MNVQDLDLLKLQSKLMQKDEAVIGFSAAISDQLKIIASEVGRALIYSNIDKLPEEALDILAWQFGADWYDSKSDIIVKRQAINDVLYLAQIRGTPAAVQRVVEIYFGDGNIEEWYEYGGDPGYFQVTTNNPDVTTTRAEEFIRVIGSVKRLTAILERVVLSQTESMNLYFGSALHVGEHITIK